MKNKGADKMGRFSVSFEIANNQDLAKVEFGLLEPSQVRRKTVSGVVDSGAALLILPQEVAKELGFPVKKSRVKVVYDDGRRGMRPEVDEVRLFLQGRDSVFNALVEPKRSTALIGAIVLEALDLLVDCKKKCLVPRDPGHKVSEIE